MFNRVGIALLLCSLAHAAPPPDSPKQTLFPAIRNNDIALLKQHLGAGADVNAKGDRNTTALMHAAAFGTLESMRILLEAGADVNAKNAFDATALMWCASDLAKVTLLVDKGADVNARSKQGRTPLIIAASHSGAEPIVRLLIAKGGDLKATDGFKTTPLIAAASANDTGVVKLLVEKGADVNAKNLAGGTALMSAASNDNIEAVRVLLKAGADVNAVSAAGGPKVKAGPLALGKFTALLLGTTFGRPELVKMLLDAGADVNAKDMRGMTPLMMSVSSEYQNPEVVRLLLARGADPKATNLDGEAAIDWAAKFAKPHVMNLLKSTPAKLKASSKTDTLLGADFSPAGLNKSLEKGLGLLQATNPSFFKEGGCAGCHHQQMTAIALGAARDKGVKFDEGAAAAQVKVMVAEYVPQGDLLLQRIDGPAGTAITSFSLLGLSAMNYPSDSVTDAMVCNVAGQQQADGSWLSGGLARSPIQDGKISETARDIHSLQAYGFPGRKAEFDERIARARKWLAAAAPKFNEERTFQLLGLKWAGADPKLIRKLAKQLLAVQRADGGWSQSEFLPSDAYATGLSLYALNQAAGVSGSDKAYQRGLKYLLKTQLADGSWYVPSRAVKFQPYFQSGFPHDHDQWISSAGAAWATASLSLGLPARPVTVASSR